MNTFFKILSAAVYATITLMAVLAPYFLLLMACFSSWHNPFLNIGAIVVAGIMIAIIKPFTIIYKATKKTNRDCGII